jgi:CxxC-x17-CxxC domain-containing protein
MGLDPEKDVIYFGRTDFRGTNKLFGIRRNDRRQHMYIIGKTGTGKSALLNNLIVQDIMNGEGVAVVDPHGELVESILEKIPENRLEDVIYFNPADPDYHIGFNVLELPDSKYKHLVASGLMGIFTKIWSNVWSARMEYIMNNAILALLDTPNSTLMGVLRILVDKDFRQQVVANVQDPVVRAFWIHEYEAWQDKFRNEAIAPIQNKVGQFLSTAMVRNIVGQSKSTVDIFDVMNSGKIFLVNVSKGRIGEDNSSLLGAMLITKMQLAAMERVRIPEDERVDFYLYVDEFQNFATDSFAGVLSEARKYRLNLIVAHQYIGQLVTDVSTKVRDAIFGNVGTMIIFRVGAGDAEFLEPEFSPEFMIPDIVNLPNHHIYLRLMVSGVTSRPFSAATLPPFKLKEPPLTPEQVISYSRKRYARKREVVEAEINRFAGVGAVNGSTTEPSAEVLAQGVVQDGNMYRVLCSNCNKETKVPFPPEPGRPVYCKDCLAGIKAGTIQPVRKRPSVATNTRTAVADNSVLASIGIEFTPEAARPREEPREERREERPVPAPREPRREPQKPRLDKTRPQAPSPQPPRRKAGFDDLPGSAEGEAWSGPRLSLSKLGESHAPTKPRKEHAHSEVNVDELRQAISASLTEDDDIDPKEK